MYQQYQKKTSCVGRIPERRRMVKRRSSKKILNLAMVTEQVRSSS